MLYYPELAWIEQLQLIRGGAFAGCAELAVAAQAELLLKPPELGCEFGILFPQALDLVL